MSLTTPPRPVDVAALFPQLASPTVRDSSAGEPSPHREGPHNSRAALVVHSPNGIRLLRR